MLTNQDIDTLLDALTCWESDISKGDMMSAMLLGIVTRGDPRSMDLAEEDRVKKSAPEKIRRRDLAIVLKAKLLSMRPGDGDKS